MNFTPPGVPFPKNFMSVAKTILKRLFRVYAHIYHQHFDSVMQLQEEAHLNTSFKHFIFFVQVSVVTLSTCDGFWKTLLELTLDSFRSSISSTAESWRRCRTSSRNWAARTDRRVSHKAFLLPVHFWIWDAVRHWESLQFLSCASWISSFWKLFPVVSITL